MTEENATASKRFSDFAKEHFPLDGKKLKIEEVLNREITVLAFRVKPSKYKNEACLTIQFLLKCEKYVVFTGSKVLADQSLLYQKELPFLATIKKIDKYFTFT